MRLVRIPLVTALVLMLAGAHPVLAQRTSTSSLLIVANNQGIFECTLNLAIFNFGTVDAAGTDYGTPNVVANGRNATDTGGTYETGSGAITWQCRAAPPSAVDMALNSVLTDHLGGLAADNLAALIPATAGGTSTGYQPFTSQADLITGMALGNGAGAVSGELALLLSIFDTDPSGSTLWVVRLRANGTP